jgi:hypothetical protein
MKKRSCCTTNWNGGIHLIRQTDRRFSEGLQGAWIREAPVAVYAARIHAFFAGWLAARHAHLPWNIQVMAAMISAADGGVGDIMRTLKENDVRLSDLAEVPGQRVNAAERHPDDMERLSGHVRECTHRQPATCEGNGIESLVAGRAGDDLGTVIPRL